MLAEEVPRVPLRPQPPAAHYLNGRAVLNGPHRGTVGRGRGGGTATSGEGERKRRGGARPDQHGGPAPIASIGYLDEHAALARNLALVVNELSTAGVLPPNGRPTELGSPYIKYKRSFAHFGCIPTRVRPSLGRARTKGHLTFITEAV